VLRCLSKEPERRYLSAGELARELERYHAGEPIEGASDSTWYLIKRKFHRHRRLVTALTATCVIIMVYAVTATVLWREATEARHGAEMARADALAKLSSARETLGFVAKEVALRLEGVPQAQRARREILDKTLTELEKLLEEHSDDPKIRAEQARTYWQLGDIHAFGGDAETGERFSCGPWKSGRNSLRPSLTIFSIRRTCPSAWCAWAGECHIAI
jgi:hypothetical protein